jgi:hypothetical protein
MFDIAIIDFIYLSLGATSKMAFGSRSLYQITGNEFVTTVDIFMMIGFHFPGNRGGCGSKVCGNRQFVLLTP